MTVAARLRAFRRDRSGLALLEFAFILPIFILLALTGTEITNYVITRMRISQLALHLADNAARMGTGSALAPKAISETDINDALTGAGLQSRELDLYRNGRVILSSLEPVANPNTTARYRIAWQRCRGAQTGFLSSYGKEGDTNLTGMGTAGRQATAPDNGATMFVEVRYRYQPIVKSSLAPSAEIQEIASMMVRDRRDLGRIYNNEGATRSTCT